MEKISVVICCFEAEEMLEPACVSVAGWADELIIVDSGSKDRTAEIAKKYATTFVVEPFRGYTEQKKFAVGLARNEWVLILDQDEEVSAGLKGELLGIAGKPELLERYDIFSPARRNYVLGRRVWAWSPDHQTRFFHRGRVTWAHHEIHDRRVPSKRSKLKKLKGHLEHRRTREPAWQDFINGRRLDDRLMPMARSMYANGKRAHWYDFVFRPPAAFFKSFILKRGFMNGIFGWMIAHKTSMWVQLRYGALWAIQNGIKERETK